MNSHPITNCLFGARSAHAVEPAGPSIRDFKYGGLCGGGERHQGGGVTLRRFLDRRLAPVTGVSDFDRCDVEGTAIQP